MSYTKTEWKDGTTPIDAANMNKIEDGIAANADDIAGLSDDLADKMYNTLAGMGAGSVYPCTTAELIQWMINNGLRFTQFRGSCSQGTITDVPINGGVLDIYINNMTSVSANWRGRIIYWANSDDRTNSMYIGRPTSGIESVNWYKVGLTAVSTTSLNVLASADTEPEDA